MRPDEVSHDTADDYYTSITSDGTVYFSRFEEHDAPREIYR